MTETARKTNSIGMKVDEEGRRFAIVTIEGATHEHLITKKYVQCADCEKSEKIKQMLMLIVDRCKSGF